MAVGLYISIKPYCKVTVPNKAKKNASLPNNYSNYFLKHWHGEHSIARSFWINYALVNLIIAFVVFFLIDNLSFTENPQLTAFLSIVMWIGYSLITIWQLVGLWRSGGNSRRILSSNWGATTQILAVLFFMGFTAQLFLNGVPQVKDFWLIGTGKDPWGQYQLRVLRDSTELEFSGSIGFGATNNVEEYLLSHPAIEIIHLNSDGGRVEEARKLASLIESRKLSTYTSLGCSSACIIPYAAGMERLIDNNARLGFHQYHHVGIVDQSEFDYDYYIDKKYLIARGINAEFLEDIFDAPPNEMWEPSHEELFQANFITKYPDDDDVAISNINDTSGFLEGFLEDPVYQVVKKEYPDDYDKIIQAWKLALEKGHSIADVRQVVVPIIMQITQQRLPHTSDEALLNTFLLSTEILKHYESVNPLKCYNFSQGSIIDPSDLPKELANKEWDLAHKVLTEHSTDSPTPSEEEVTHLFDEVYFNVALIHGEDVVAYIGDNIDSLATEEHLKEYCSITISIFEEIFELPVEDSVKLLRVMVQET